MINIETLNARILRLQIEAKMDTTFPNKLSDPFGFTGSTQVANTPRLHDPFAGSSSSSWDQIVLDESLSTLASTSRFVGQASISSSVEDRSPSRQRRTNDTNEWRTVRHSNNRLMSRDVPNTPSSIRHLNSSSSSTSVGVLGSSYSPHHHDMRVDERRRSLLGWASASMLDMMGVFDALDALEVISTYNKVLRRLAGKSPWLTPCSKTLYEFLKDSRTVLGDTTRLKSIERLAFLKDDPKLPIPIFREVEQCLLHYPPFLLNLSYALFQLPGFNCHRKARQINNSIERVARVLSSTGIWVDDQPIPVETFLFRFKQSIRERCPEWLVSLPYRMSEFPTGVLVETLPMCNGCSQVYCILEPQHLDTLLNNSRTSGVDSLTVRDCITSARDEFDAAAIMVTRAATTPNDPVAASSEAATSYLSPSKDLAVPSSLSSPSRTPPLTRFSARSTPVHAAKRGVKIVAAAEELSTTGIPSHFNNVSSGGDEGQNDHSPWTPICTTPSLRESGRAGSNLVVDRVTNELQSRVSPPSRILWPAKSLGQV